MMPPPRLTRQQETLIGLPPDSHIFLEGPAGCGKTAAAVERILCLIDQGIPQDSILVLLPQRSLAAPYQAALRRADLPPGGLADILTVGGLARRMVELFWPLAAGPAGFAFPDRPPTFLTLETAQYTLARVARPLLDRGYFDSVTIDRPRLYTQIIDNLNKASVVGFPHTEIAPRLSAAWRGDPAQRHVYEDAQDCAARFRAYCLGHNLLDFSLQLEVFFQHVWPQQPCRDYLVRRYSHLVYDNIEEDTPVAHDLVADWLPDLQSALLIQDWDGGYRRFLGADALSAGQLKNLCPDHLAWTQSLVTPPPLQVLGQELARSLCQEPDRSQIPPRSDGGDMRSVLAYQPSRFYPQMVDWLAQEIAHLVHDCQVPPGEIAVLSPFLSDSLRFSMMERLARAGVPVRSHRPSRGLHEEPAARCLLTLAALAHPAWRICPSREEVGSALMQAVDELDLVRAHLLTGIVYRPHANAPALTSFDQIRADMQERISFTFGQRYQFLFEWIRGYQQGPPLELDHFVSRLFGEVLSQAGFGFHRRVDAGEVTASLIESIRKFRWEVGPTLQEDETPVAPEYYQTVQDGLVAAQYVQRWQSHGAEAVLLAPAHTFLLANRPVEIQFWLDVGSLGWWQRLYQPLTQPYVLSRTWPAGAAWTDADEVAANQESLYLLCLGLIRRCRGKIYLGLSELGEQGFEQRGPLLNALQQVLRRHPIQGEAVRV